MAGYSHWILSTITVQWFMISMTTALKESVRLNNEEANCMSELMSKQYLDDDQFSASNYSQQKHHHHPSAARLLNIHSQSDSSDGSAWCPETLAHKDINEWIEVDFRRMTVINQIYTMGRGNGNYKEFTPEIMIKYQRSARGPWLTYRRKQLSDVLVINTDSRTKIRSALQTIIAKRIRIYPLATISGPKSVCLKFAFLGCFIEDEAMSYTAPQGDLITMGNVSVNLRDDVYDGQTTSTMLTNGLGLLMDNYAWRKDFDLVKDIRDNQMTVFTGWSCPSKQNSPYINITFNFEQERDFRSLMLFSVKDRKHKVDILGSIVVSIGKDNEFSHITTNATDLQKDHSDLHEYPILILLNHLIGDTCIINITCGSDNLILLSEIEIKSVPAKSIRTDVPNLPNPPPSHQYSNTTDKHTTSLFPDYPMRDSVWRQQDITVMAMVLLVILLLIFVIGMGVMCFKFQRSRRSKLTKKLELVAQSNNQSMCHQTPVTVFTIQSKTPAMTTVQQPKYFSESKTAYSAAYSGSQPSEGVYASWPNTDEDADIATLDKEEEKCLLATEIGERTSMKEYATYQCGMNTSTANEYIITDGTIYRPQVKTRPLSIVTTLPNLSTWSVPLLKIASHENTKSTPIVTYKSTKKPAPSNFDSTSYQHFLNYRGICGDVDFRYQSSYSQVDQTNLENNIRVIPISSLIPIQTLIRSEFGAISVCKIVTDTYPQSGTFYFVKNINSDSKTATKSNFIMDLKILSSLNCTNIAKLEAIAIDSDMTSSHLVSIIKSTRFYILIDYLNGYNLKDFLRNTYYSNVSQECNSTQSLPYRQISLSSLLIIITQIANGMKHLEDLSLTHRDLACRNCIIDMRMHVKIYPGSWVTAKSNEDYCSIELINHQVMFPLRWMAPESIIGGLFTNKSDVWSFAVTLWEIFTLCCLVPYGSLTNEALLDLMSHKNNTPRLPCPQSCPKDIFDLMSQCWHWDESMRPSFGEIHKFLHLKATNSTSQAQIILPAPPPDDKKS